MKNNTSKSLGEDGYAIIPGFLTSDMLSSLQDISANILENLSKAHRENFKATGSLCNFGDHPEYADLISLPKVADVMDEFGYDSYKWLAGYLISKPGIAPPLFWHQDWWGWSDNVSYGDKPLGLGFMYYLSDTSPENGCLRVIPGTHRNWHALHDLPEAHNEELSRAKDITSNAFQSHPDEVSVEVKAGDLVVMDSRLLHSAYANNSGNERSLLTLWYLPEYDTMPGPIRGELQKIFSRTDLDIDGGEKVPSSPLDWNVDVLNKIKSLVPEVRGKFAKPTWQRVPERSRMQTDEKAS